MVGKNKDLLVALFIARTRASALKKMPPRFLNEHVIPLKQRLLLRVPECLFTAEDVEQLQKDTGLEAPQIKKYADNVRSRVLPEKRQTFLSEPEQDVEKVASPRLGTAQPSTFSIVEPTPHESMFFAGYQDSPRTHLCIQRRS
jgi:hypothetical protein